MLHIIDFYDMTNKALGINSEQAVKVAQRAFVDTDVKRHFLNFYRL